MLPRERGAGASEPLVVNQATASAPRATAAAETILAQRGTRGLLGGVSGSDVGDPTSAVAIGRKTVRLTSPVTPARDGGGRVAGPGGRRR